MAQFAPEYSLQELKQVGCIIPSIFRDIEIYEYYLNERKNTKEMKVREKTAQKFCISAETIKRIVKRMK